MVFCGYRLLVHHSVGWDGSGLGGAVGLAGCDHTGPGVDPTQRLSNVGYGFLVGVTVGIRRSGSVTKLPRLRLPRTAGWVGWDTRSCVGEQRLGRGDGWDPLQPREWTAMEP